MFLEFDEQPAEYEVIVEGEGYVDPTPGVYSIEKGNNITMNAQSADGWLISAIYINDERVPIEEHSVNYSLKIDSDTVILIQFITLEVSIPTGSEYIYDGSDIVAYADDALYTVVGGNAIDAGNYTATLSLTHTDFCHWSDGWRF